MKASLDTNVIIHLYSAGEEDILFDYFEDGIYVDTFIVDVELKRHGQQIIDKFKQDVRQGKIQIIDKEWLKSNGVLGLYEDYYNDDKYLFEKSDEGELRAIALARVLGATVIVTDDTKSRGPHFTLMRLPDSDVIPMTFYEILFFMYLENMINEEQVGMIFDKVITSADNLPFDANACLNTFIRRFIQSPYSNREKTWFENYCQVLDIDPKAKLKQMYNYIKE